MEGRLLSSQMPAHSSYSFGSRPFPEETVGTTLELERALYMTGRHVLHKYEILAAIKSHADA